MKAKYFLWHAAVLWLSFASSQELQEPPPVITTESFEFPVFETTERPTEPPNDNGMAIGDVSGRFDLPPSAVEGKEEEPYAVQEQPVVVTFPENHKNFTPSQYLEEQSEFPPYYNHLNSYQQQYKNYYEQKQNFNRKPIKFEENSLKNYYLPSGTDAVDVENEKKNQDIKIHNPFPYVFDKEKVQEQKHWPKNTGHVAVQEQNNWYKDTGHAVAQEQNNWYKETGHAAAQEQSNWYKDTGHVAVQEQQTNEHGFRGHQEVPYYVYPHTYPQEINFYKDELLHYDHHHVKKDEKGNPWKKVFHVLTALVPLGLLLATLTPNVISINSTATSKTTRQRSEDSPQLQFKEEDVLRLMKKYGVESLSEMQCEDRVLCELAKEGGKTTAGPIEKGFWFLANRTPLDVAEKAGMNELFKTIKTGNCEVFKCHSNNKSDRKGSFGKKLIRKHKTPE